jgi:peptide/nickel transport system permease protein
MTEVLTAPTAAPAFAPAGARGIFRNPRMSVSLVVGVGILVAVFGVALVGSYFVDHRMGEVGAVPPGLRPSAQYPLGTDSQGRELFTILILGTPQTFRIGLMAGAVGLSIGLTLGLVAGYFGGVLDALIRVVTDSIMTVPGIAILIIIAANVGGMTIDIMALTVASLAWTHPARSIRAQVLSIRERPYVQVARANGESELEIVFREVLPNLIPYVAAGFVGAVSGAMLASVGLEVLGLGANNVHTLGTAIFWAQKYSAILRGQWWWWAPPIATIATIFFGMYLLSAGLDKFANPRLRHRT